ncbi:MAG: putative protein YunC [Candidatus Methanocomedens sp.]|jgi:uncharacterized protein YunC (DUF1805 family)|nr:MAG: putative protein YunC [ANME-2 cluster archaeon]
MQVESIELENGTALGLKMDMEHAPLLVIRAPRGFVMCGYLDISMAEQLDDVAVKVRGVRNFEDVLASGVVEVTKAAIDLGIEVGMPARQALERMF